MRPNTARPVTRAWALLALLTILSMMAGHAGATGIARNGLVLAVAIAKGRWMLLDFLELRHAPSGWRFLLLSWLVLVAVLAWSAPALRLLLG